MSQNARLLSYLQRYGYITQLVASKVFQIDRLASRIHDLKKAGVVIQANYLRDDNNKKYTRYVLVG